MKLHVFQNMLSFEGVRSQKSSAVLRVHNERHMLFSAAGSKESLETLQQMLRAAGMTLKLPKIRKCMTYPAALENQRSMLTRVHKFGELPS